MAEGRFVPVARVVKAHGLKGELSVASLVSDPNPLIEGLEVWFVPPHPSVRSGRIVSTRPGPKGLLATVDTVTDRHVSSALTGATIVVREADAPVGPEEDDLDVIGVRVTDRARGFLGEIDEVIVTGANDVWVLSGGPFGEVLVPVIADSHIVLTADGEYEIDLLAGLLEDDET